MRQKQKVIFMMVSLALVCFSSVESLAADKTWGVKIQAGGRFDNIRMCVATPAGVKGGPAVDFTLFADLEVAKDMVLTIDVPFFRPILFGVAFSMLQFEPDVTLNFIRATQGYTRWFFGPALGISLHYGPDYNSERSGAGRGPSFFALGPRIGAYVGLDFRSPQKTHNFQIGIRPYVIPMFSIGDSENHQGIVVGGMLEGRMGFDIVP